jgi:hypothetical protein
MNPIPISSELIHLVELATWDCQRDFAVLMAAEVQQQKLVSGAGREFVLLNIDGPNPVTRVLQLMTKWPPMNPPAPQTSARFKQPPRLGEFPASLTSEEIVDFRNNSRVASWLRSLADTLKCFRPYRSLYLPDRYFAQAPSTGRVLMMKFLPTEVLPQTIS